MHPDAVGKSCSKLSTCGKTDDLHCLKQPDGDLRSGRKNGECSLLFPFPLIAAHPRPDRSIWLNQVNVYIRIAVIDAEVVASDPAFILPYQYLPCDVW
jgi:hypothetical protein